MEQLYGLGVTCIQFVQEWLPYEGYYDLVNELSNPYHATEKLLPLVSVVDSVFAAQLLLCLSFGGWLNTVMKWWILEDRPYWWVHETTYYADVDRPKLKQTHQTCETGPGSPSGHSATMALILTLCITSAAHVANDRKWQIPPYIHKVAVAAAAVTLASVFLARMYVSAHFPHQCILGALFGLFISPALCIYVSDPYIWCYGRYASSAGTVSARVWHVASTACAGAISMVTYWALTACNQDPQFTVKLAFRWCEFPEHLHVSTTPVFALIQCMGYMLGWALAVTPAVAKYRHDTKERSLIISAIGTALVIYGHRLVNERLCKSNTFRYYASKFIMYAVLPMFYLRIIPALSMWPFTSSVKNKIE